MPSDSSRARRGGLDRKGGKRERERVSGGVLRDRVGWIGGGGRSVWSWGGVG